MEQAANGVQLPTRNSEFKHYSISGAWFIRSRKTRHKEHKRM